MKYSSCLLSFLSASLVAGCAVSPGSPQSATAARSAALTADKSAQQGPDYRTNYRLAAAQHIYARNRERIYSGVMPHHLHAVAVLEIKLDAEGRLLALHWVRAPNHAPEVIAEIERTVRRAAPFPAPFPTTTPAPVAAPPTSGSTNYVDTWLWHVSGQFQLHTLSEGQGP